ncbi:hypothetical protein [Deinococcus sedimenti]|uniref:Peptide chain release factor 2 n=1 Tax=Deinococcus sedimenti TaxID=1867090 RepID=A0ABQ2S1L7_9DEIO|nr:hypothetical protein [Deinococcus sedimenti]GGR84679.1 hypothetical protein GCM10008960_09630 [Deinococcus sedimenti]
MTQEAWQEAAGCVRRLHGALMSLEPEFERLRTLDTPDATWEQVEQELLDLLDRINA